MAEYIEREELARFLRNEIVECETALNNMETPYEHQLEEEAVSGRMQAMVDVWRKVINKAPADVVEVKHGEWELHGNDDSLGCSYFCSSCWWNMDEDEFLDNWSHFKFCPNCGAKMDKKEGAEE